jgi:Uma2 family endonuclease
MPARPAPSAERKTTPRFRTLADVIARLGVPPDRIRMKPPPGTATEADLGRVADGLCELIDGTLVEKATGDAESVIGSNVARLIGNHVAAGEIGVVMGEAGYVRLDVGTVRAPDVTFIPWGNLPNEEYPDEAYWPVPPGLIVEVLSPSNTAEEIDRKLAAFFAAGCRLAWVIDPPTRTAKVYTSARRFKVLDESGVLDGGKVLPGFTLPVADVFPPRKRPRKRR